MRNICSALLCAALLGNLACKKDEEAPPAKPVAKTEPARTEPAKTEPAKTEPPRPAADPALVERGKYLVENVAGCNLCHTAMSPDAKPYAGGLEIQEAWGTWRTPNITQDKKTGIGDWTDEQIIASVREGKRPNGDLVWPIMPFMFYSRLSDDDAKAMVAYLRTIPAVENAVAGNDLPFPKMPGPPPTHAAPEADPVKQGEYYATLMACAHCHTPMTKEGGPDQSKFYAGGMEMELPQFGEGKLYTPNITPDAETGIGKWTDEQVAAAITKMVRPDGRPILPPMALFARSWSGMKAEDIGAVVKFLKALPPTKHKVPASTFKPKAPPPPGK